MSVGLMKLVTNVIYAKAVHHFTQKKMKIGGWEKFISIVIWAISLSFRRTIILNIF